MQTSDFKSHYIRVAGTIALAGNGALAAAKLVLASLSGSLAVMGDGIDSATDVLIAVVTLVISGIIARPSDKGHPWGHGRAETTATLLLSFVIFFAGAQLVVQSAKTLAAAIGGSAAHPVSTVAVAAALVSIAGKGILTLLQFRYARIADSDIVRANALNMKSDIMLSAGVLAGLFASHVFRCPVLDPVIALLVGAWVIKNAVGIFMQTNTELMDGSDSRTLAPLYQKLFEAAASVPGVSNPHRARIRKIASYFDIDLDIEVVPDMTVYDAHELSEQVEEAVRLRIPEVYDIVVHIEPAGSDSHQPTEQFGLTPEKLL